MDAIPLSTKRLDPARLRASSPVAHRARSSAIAAIAVAASIGAASRASASPSTTSIAQGYDLGEIQNPRAMALGGAQNALGTSTTALYLNPANLSFARVYHFEGLVALAPEARRQSYGGAIVDSLTNRLAGGLAGSWSQMDPDGVHRAWSDLRLALAYPLGDYVSVGVTGRYLRVEQGIATGPLGASPVSDGTAGKPLLNLPTFDAGVTIAPTTGLRIGAVGHNLTSPGTSLAPTTLAAGIGYTSRDFGIEVGPLFDFTTWSQTKARVMGGAEVFLADHFPLRFGYRYDDALKVSSIGGGLGYVDAHWSFELATRREVSGPHPITFMTAAFRYFYDSVRLPEEGESF